MEPARASEPASDTDRPRWRGRTVEHWVVLALALAGVAGLVLLALLVSPDARGLGTHEQLGLPPCAWIERWGIPCPGCGVTTSVALCLHGHPIAAFTTQPFGPLVVLACLAAAGLAVALHLCGRDLLPVMRRVRWVTLAIVGTMALLAAWIYKLAAMHGA